jgi:L-iditol 2-dehydrogenase
MNCGRSLALMSAGKLVTDHPIITHHFKLGQIREAFDTYMNRVGNALKVAIHV